MYVCVCLCSIGNCSVSIDSPAISHFAYDTMPMAHITLQSIKQHFLTDIDHVVSKKTCMNYNSTGHDKFMYFESILSVYFATCGLVAETSIQQRAWFILYNFCVGAYYYCVCVCTYGVATARIGLIEACRTN